MDALIGYFGGHAHETQALMGRRPVGGLDYPDSQAAGSISFDYPHATRLALDHLLSTDRSRLAFLDSNQGGPGDSRGAAVAAAADLGVPLSVVEAAPSAEGAQETVVALLANHAGGDGLLAFNDLMAAGALKAFRALGKFVPEECAAAGMDGIPLGELVTPELTTFSLDLRAVGRAAVGLVFSLLSGAAAADSHATSLVLRHELDIRQSA